MSIQMNRVWASALPILASIVGVACGDDEAADGTGGSGTTTATTTTSSTVVTSGDLTGTGGGDTSGGTGGQGGEGGCTEITVTLAQIGWDGEGPTYLVGESSPSGDPERDSFVLSLRADGDGAYETGDVELGAGDAASYATCRTCLLVFEDILDARTYFATSGTATVDPASVPGAARVELTDVTLSEVTIDDATSASTIVPGGRCLHVVSSELDGIFDDEVCDDDVDDDNDDLVDCSDPDCSATPDCEAERGAVCAAAVTLTPGTPITATSADGTRALTYDDCEAGFFTGGGPEHVYVMTPETTGLAKIRLQTDVDLGIYVRESCVDPSTTIACSDAWGEFAETEWMNVPVEAGVPLYVVVDSYAESAPDGQYVLEASIDPFVAGDRCDDVAALPADETRDFAELGPDVVLSPAVAADCTGGALGRGVEAVYQVVLAAGEQVDVTVTPTGYGDPVLYLSDACGAEVTTCLAGADAGSYGEAETLTFTSATGGTYFLFVDSGTSTSLQYAYSLVSTVQ